MFPFPFSRIRSVVTGLGRDRSIARWIVRHRIMIAIAWFLAAVVLVPLSSRLEDSLAVTATIPGGESAAVTEMLMTQFASPFAQTAVLVVTGIPDPRTPAGQPVLNRIVDEVETIPGVAATLSYRDTGDAFYVADDGTGAFLIAGLDTGTESVDSILHRLRHATTVLADTLQLDAPGLRLRWTGEAALNHDIRAVGQSSADTAELRALPLTLAVLMIVFGSVTAALLPLLAGLLAIPLALGVATLLSGHWQISALLVNVVTMIGLALSIDYSLLVVHRFRQARAAGLAPQDAAVETAHRAGHTVVLSGLAVAVGFAALLAVPLIELRSVAIGGLLITIVAVLVATTLLPGVLSWLGDRTELGRIRPRFASAASGRLWSRWGGFVAKHPVAILLVAGLPVVTLAMEAPRLKLELPRGDWMPSGTDSAEAIDDLRGMGRGGVIDSLRIVLVTPHGTTVLDSSGWRALERLTTYLVDEPRIERVTSLNRLAGGDAVGAGVLNLMPEKYSRALISEDRRATLIEVTPSRQLESFEVSLLVRNLKSKEADALTGLAGTRILIGGLPEFEVEYEDAVTASFPAVVGLVLVGTLLTLMVCLRSVLIPLKALVLNLLSVAAGFGAIVILFQDGLGAGLLGLAGPTGAVYPVIPALVFCAVFGLSMDYEIFLVASVAEHRAAGIDDGSAVAAGLAQTGSLITGAAAVMIIVFGAFTLGDFLLMKMLGVALAVTVLIDATLVRTAIGPALLCIAGRWNWWPGDNARSGTSRDQFRESPVTTKRGVTAGARLRTRDPIGTGSNLGVAEKRWRK